MSQTKIHPKQIEQQSPQGFLINGKIVPSTVETTPNRLVVAIKGMDGNDPSTSNPVYIRIGDTVRSITSALSITKSLGTNWFNAGSAELATKEIDYFVYLGYNSTDGVVIGFARIPGATQYDDFSTTTTDEKYCAISTITNASSTDYYENIGRFAATLSAGTGYEWTVPTFTSKNLIQRPIFETRWLNCVPTCSGSGSMTWTGLTINMAKYQIIQDTLYYQVYIIGTTGGTAANSLNVSTPFAAKDTVQGIGSLTQDGARMSAFSFFNGVPTTVSTRKYNYAVYGLGTLRDVIFTVPYEI